MKRPFWISLIRSTHKVLAFDSDFFQMKPNSKREHTIMNMGKWHYLIVTFGAFLLCGCQSPKFSYPAPSLNLKPTGPTVTVQAIVDGRTNRAMDRVLAKGYFVDVQLAIANELQSINLFSAVIAVTNTATFPQSDFTIIPKVNRLEWEIPITIGF
jgi:hypothetical protein